MAKSMTLVRGAVISVPNLWTKSVTRIDQKEYDSFQITVGEGESASVIDINTRGYDRLPEPEPDYSTGTPRRRLIENAESLPLEASDLISIPELGWMFITGILQIRAGRYQLKISEKYQYNVVVDIDMGR